jgi:hypothetical protein
MKKIILTVAAVFVLSFANAQDKKESSEGFAKGDLYLSGSFGISNDKTGDFKENGFEVIPAVGYFLTENLALEGSIGYASTTEDDGVDEFKTNGLGVAVGVKYFWTPASKFSLSLGGNISYTTTKEDDGTFDVTTKEIGFNVPLGLHYFVSDSFAITTSWGGLSYTTNDNGGDGADKTNSLNLGVDLSSINFGLIYKL